MRTRYQFGTVCSEERQRGPAVWMYRYNENGKHKNVQIGTPEQVVRVVRWYTGQFWEVGSQELAAVPNQAGNMTGGKAECRAFAYVERGGISHVKILSRCARRGTR
jgi:hypothetical protein